MPGVRNMNRQAPGHDEHHIEPRLQLGKVPLALHKCGGGTGDTLLLAGMNGVGGGAGVGALLYLNEGDGTAAGGHEVYLAHRGARAPGADAPAVQSEPARTDAFGQTPAAFGVPPRAHRFRSAIARA